MAAFNTASLNSGAINAGQLGTEVYSISRQIEQEVFEVYAVTRSFEQEVFEVYAVTRSFEQTVVFREIYTLTRGIQQTINAVYVVSRQFNQSVSNVLPSSDAVIWTAYVIVDDAILTDIVGGISVSAGENESRLATFQARPVAGTLNWSDVIAKTVAIDYRDNTGQFRRLFTGIIDEVQYDATSNLLQYECTSNRKDDLAALTRSQLDARITGARWSKYIFDEESEGLEYASELLSTIPASYEEDAYGQYRLAQWEAKATPDLTLTESDIIDGSLVPTFVSRDRILNQVNLEFGYRFSRLRHRERVYTWNLLQKTSGADGYNNWAEFLQNPTILLPRDAVDTAIHNTSWVVKGTIAYTDLPPAGYYSGIGWTPKQTTITYDEKGRQIRTVTDISAVYTTTADFTLAKRFAQPITEEYQLTITAPQSTGQYGVVDTDVRRGMTAEYDVSEWEGFTAYTAPTGTLSSNGDYIIDQDGTDIKGGRDEFDNAVETAIAIAYHDIKDSHRQNYVDFTILLDSSIELHQTIYVNTTRVQAKGKVVNIEHELQIDDDEPSALTTVRLAISKAQGSQTETTIASPTQPSVGDEKHTPPIKTLLNHFGNHYRSPAYDEQWSGWITNYQFQDFISSSLNRYPVAYVVDGEKIGDSDRKERTVDAPQTYNVEIPNDLLTITAP